MPLLACVSALVVGAGILLLAGSNPIDAYLGLLDGAFGSPTAIRDTLVWTTPYVFVGLGVAFAFRAGLFNIGAEGQLALGAVTAAWLGGLLLALPGVIHAPLALVGGALAGAVWGGIPGWLKARTGAHEVINTMMMNYLALGLVGYLLNGPLRDPSPFNVIARTAPIAPGARLPELPLDGLVPTGLVLALAAAGAVWAILYKTPFGFALRTVGANPEAARYAGMGVGRTIVLAMAASGLLAGLAGAVEVVAVHYRHELGYSVGYGFEAIVVALLGRTHPLGVVPAALLLGALRSGATRMQFLTQVPVDIVVVIQALILLGVAAGPLVRRLYHVRGGDVPLTLTRGWRAN